MFRRMANCPILAYRNATVGVRAGCPKRPAKVEPARNTARWDAIRRTGIACSLPVERSTYSRGCAPPAPSDGWALLVFGFTPSSCLTVQPHALAFARFVYGGENPLVLGQLSSVCAPDAVLSA